VVRFIVTMPKDFVFVQLDFSTLLRDVILEAVADEIPEIGEFCHLACPQHPFLNFGIYTIHHYVPGGCPCSKARHHYFQLVGLISYCILCCFLSVVIDDFSLGDPEDVVARDIDSVLTLGAALRIKLNNCQMRSHPSFDT
jgi:hypothetical protein